MRFPERLALADRLARLARGHSRDRRAARAVRGRGRGAVSRRQRALGTSARPRPRGRARGAGIVGAAGGRVQPRDDQEGRDRERTRGKGSGRGDGVSSGRLRPIDRRLGRRRRGGRGALPSLRVGLGGRARKDRGSPASAVDHGPRVTIRAPPTDPPRGSTPMIGRLTGTLLASRPDEVVVDVGGVGYRVHIPLEHLLQAGRVAAGGLAARAHARAGGRHSALRLLHRGRKDGLPASDRRVRNRPQDRPCRAVRDRGRRPGARRARRGPRCARADSRNRTGRPPSAFCSSCGTGSRRGRVERDDRRWLRPRRLSSRSEGRTPTRSRRSSIWDTRTAQRTMPSSPRGVPSERRPRSRACFEPRCARSCVRRLEAR